MTTITASMEPPAQLCKGQCRQTRPLFEFYRLGTNDPRYRLVCKDCWKAVNAQAFTRRKTQRLRRKELLGLSKKSKRSV